MPCTEVLEQTEGMLLETGFRDKRAAERVLVLVDYVELVVRVRTHTSQRQVESQRFMASVQ